MGDTETKNRKNEGDMIWDDDNGDVVENCYLDPKGWWKKRNRGRWDPGNAKQNAQGNMGEVE